MHALPQLSSFTSFRSMCNKVGNLIHCSKYDPMAITETCGFWSHDYDMETKIYTTSQERENVGSLHWGKNKNKKPKPNKQNDIILWKFMSQRVALWLTFHRLKFCYPLQWPLVTCSYWASEIWLSMDKEIFLFLFH